MHKRQKLILSEAQAATESTVTSTFTFDGGTKKFLNRKLNLKHLRYVV